MTEAIRRWVRRALPLAWRTRLALVVGRQAWFEGRGWWVLELLRDQAERDPNAFHRFLWSHHLAYAETYEVGSRFGNGNLHPSRRLLFDDLRSLAAERGLSLDEVKSVFEVGCSLGYLLRHIETEVCPGATLLEGNDIDAQAVREGNAHLAAVGSKVRLHAADMAALGSVFAGRRFDLVLCAGVLMYLRESDAAAVVADILRHTGRLAIFAGLAHPDFDNAALTASVVRERDGTFIHNLDHLIESRGGKVLKRRWEGSRSVGGNTIYFLFAEPATVS